MDAASSSAAVELPNGQAASGAFGRRAGRVVSNAALYQLVEDMAHAVDRQQKQITEIHEMCTRLLVAMTEKGE